MKRFVFASGIGLLVAALNLGCNAEELKQLNEQVQALTTENASLKAKVADLEKNRTDLQNAISGITAERDQTRKDLEECSAKSTKGGKKVAKTAGASAPEEKETKKTKAGSGGGKPKFSAPKRAK
jgi:prefoldin subunit 5